MRVFKISLFILIVFCACKQEKISLVPQAIPKPLDIFLLLDQSGSMTQTDPQNNRIEAAKFLVDYLATYWGREQDHRLGLINFGDLRPPNPEDEMANLTSLDTANRAKIDTLKQKIRPLALGNTKFIDAFRKAKQGFLITEDTIPRQKVIMLLTDGEPDDERGLSRDAYFREIITYFNDSLSDCHLYVLAIDIRNRYWQTNEPYWRRIAKYTERLVSVEEERLKEAFWQVISMELEVVAEKWFLIPPEGLKVALDPYLEGVTFTFHRDFPHAEIKILDPKGIKISEKPPKITKLLDAPKTVIWKIDEPMPGDWICMIERGMGRVEVGPAKIPIQPRLIYPKETHPQGKPFVIWASFLRRDGKPIKEHRAYALKMGASLRYPGITTFTHFDLTETKDIGIFVAKETVRTAQEGEYEIVLNMMAHKPITETLIPVRVVKMPYIEVVRPKNGEVQPWHKNLAIEAEIRLAGSTVNPAEYFINNPNTMLFYQIIDVEQNEVIKSGHPKYVGGEREAKFLANAGKIKKNGKYRVVIKLRGERPDRTIYEYSTNPNGTTVYKRMNIIDFFIYYPYLVALIILFIIFVWDWQRIGRENEWWGWRINCPQLMGNLEIIRKMPTEQSETLPEEKLSSSIGQKKSDSLYQEKISSPTEEKRLEEQEPKSNLTQEILAEPQSIPLKGRKKQFKEIGITLIARRIKEPDVFGGISDKTKIFIKWENSLKPDEELKQCVEIPINNNVNIHYYP